MANIFRSLLDAMKFSDDEDDDDDYKKYLEGFDDDEEEPAPAPKKNLFERETPKTAIQEVPSKKYPVQDEQPRKPRLISESKGKVVPLRNNKELEVKVVKPTSFSDCQDICDILLNGDAVIINLEGFDAELSQRVMDFVSGTIYAIKGKISTISRFIYVVSPENVTISGDVMNLLTSGGVEAPTFSSDF